MLSIIPARTRLEHDGRSKATETLLDISKARQEAEPPPM
jgi:hypothetical protein